MVVVGIFSRPTIVIIMDTAVMLIMVIVYVMVIVVGVAAIMVENARKETLERKTA